jgi:hypothetical protein
MTAHELAKQLLDGPDAEVALSYDYGNRQHTSCCETVTEAKATVIKPWPYAGEGKACVVEDSDEGGSTYEDMEEWQSLNEGEEPPEGARVAIVLS